MKNLLFATGATISAISLMATASAQASTRTFDFEADTSVKVEFEQLWVGRDISGFTVPNRIDVVGDNVMGSFTVLDDPAQITDGDIELNYGLFDNLLGSSYNATLDSFLSGFGLTSSQARQSADDIFNITGFTGNGELTSQDPSLAGDPNNPSAFNITYNNGTNSVLINGYDTDVAESCLSAACQFTGDISFGVSLVVSEFVSFTGDLLNNSNVTLTPEARSSLNNLLSYASLVQILNPTAVLDLATVTANVNASTDLASTNANGSSADIAVNVTNGSLIATATTGNTQEQLFNRQLSVAPPSNPPAITQQLSPAPTSGSPSNSGTTSGSPSSGGSGSVIPGPSTTNLPSSLGSGNPIPQDVPEPSIMLGLLGTAAFLAKQGKKKTAVH